MKYKRYPKYKDSGVEWLGEIPAHWDRIRLKFMVENVNNKSNPSNAALPYVGLENIESFTGRWIDSLAENTGEGTATRFAPEHLLFGKLRPYLAKAFLPSFHGRCSTEFLVLRPDRLEKKFIFYLLLSDQILKHIDSSSYGTKMPRASWEFVGNLPLVAPERWEQIAISRFLDRETAKIDALVAKKDRLIELLQEKRTALIARAATKGLDPNVPMKDSGVEWLGDIPEHWEVSKLGFHASVKARLGWKGLKAEEYVEDGYISLATPNIKKKEIDFKNVNYITAARYFESQEIMLQLGDVLIAKDGSTLGITNVVRDLPAPATVNSSIAVVRPHKTLQSIFLYYLLSSHFTERSIRKMEDGQGVPHLFQADLRRFWVWLPALQEQEAIADFLDRETAKIDALIAKTRQAIDRLKEYRTALISAAVTGKIDVRQQDVNA